MSYNYNIIRSGNVIPLTSVLRGYNASGTTANYTNMGSFTVAISTYRKAITGFLQNGNEIYEANIVEGIAGSIIYTTVPTGCTKVRLFCLGAGGGAGGGYSPPRSASKIGNGGGGGAFYCRDVIVSAGTSISLYTGYGGGGSTYPSNASAGQSSNINVGGFITTCNGGGGGNNGSNSNTFGGAGGTVVSPSGTMIDSYNGETAMGNTAYNDPFSGGGVSDGSGRGGYSGVVYGGYSTSTYDNNGSGRGGSASYSSGGNGTNGYTSVHFLY